MRENTNGTEIDFTGPAFRDYGLAYLMNTKHEDIVLMYIYEQKKSYFPSSLFAECYLSLSKNNAYSQHLRYIYDSFMAKLRVHEHLSLVIDESDDANEANASFNILRDVKNDVVIKDAVDVVVSNERRSFRQYVMTSNL